MKEHYAQAKEQYIKGAMSVHIKSAEKSEESVLGEESFWPKRRGTECPGQQIHLKEGLWGTTISRQCIKKCYHKVLPTVESSVPRSPFLRHCGSGPRALAYAAVNTQAFCARK